MIGPTFPVTIHVNLAFGCSALGSLFKIILTNITLSIPNTSNKVNTKN
jgi:hypothetical protein